MIKTRRILGACAALATAANAQAQPLHFSFSAGSTYTYAGSPTATPVTGSFDFDPGSGLLSNVVYNSVSGAFTTGAEYTSGVDTEIYFGTLGSSNYDVYQLGSGLSAGGTVNIVSGTHPGIFIDARGSLSSAVAATVPEPASWAAMIGGLGLIGVAVRRRRTAARVALA